MNLDNIVPPCGKIQHTCFETMARFFPSKRCFPRTKAAWRPCAVSYFSAVMSVILLVLVSLPSLAIAVTAFPSSATVLTGTYSSGNAASLISNDNVFYVVNSTTTGTRTAAWYGSFPSIPKSLTSLNVNYRGKNSRNCTQTIAIWNWITSAWVQLNSRTVGTTEVAINNLLPSGTPGDYVSGAASSGEVRVRTQCQATANLANSGETMSIVYSLPNTPPTISAITAQQTNEDTVTGAIAFTVGDAETAVGSLTLSGSSSNTTLVPNGNIVFGGSGANRTLTITPTANQNGTATITVMVSDGQTSTPTSFLLTVNAVNDAPTITPIANQTTTPGTAVGPLDFTVGDVETAAGSLTVSGSSLNTTLIPNGNIVFGGNGANRTVTITPVANQSGTATITVTVSDGQTSTPTSFQVTVSTTPSGALAAGWNFNEGSGSFAFDISGNDNTASLGNSSMWGAGEYGGGISFSGNSYLTVPNSPSLDISGNALTLSMWINPQPSGGGDSVVLGKFWNTTMAAPYYQYGLELFGGSTPDLFIGTAGGPVHARMGSSLPSGQWSHLAVVFNGSQALFYVNCLTADCVPVSTVALSASIAPRGNHMFIGADADGSQIFNGSLDDLRIYPRVLTQSEIQADMNTPLGGGSGSAPPTVSITSPTNNAQVHDIITVTADASDDIAVTGVQFLVDGVITGSEDTNSPYGLSWDTRAITNGTHTLTARARDSSGNVTVSAPIAVNVANSNFFQNEILATGFNLPTAIKFLPDGRMLVVELPGIIKVLPPPYTQPDPTPFLNLNLNITGYEHYQQGIFDIVLDPDFVTNRYYYIFYTNDSPNRDRLSRFTANATLDGTVTGSEVILYEDPQVPNTEHHGGAINFGNDGKIYFTTGEHFNAGDAQLLSSPRGKIHRINSDGTIPTDNPFYDGAGPNSDSIWALGLRNPYRAYYDAPTGRLFIGDVGGNDYSTAKEEVNIGVRGANYGWPNYEGPCPGQCTSPIHYYAHNGRDASVTGGFVYHGTQFPSAYQGNYFFADYTQNWIRRLTFDAAGNVNGVFNFEPADGSVDGPYGDIVYLTEGPDGALYYVDLGYSDVGGTFGISKIRRIRYLQTNQAPVAVASASSTTGPAPLIVNFSSNGSLDPEGQTLSYSWIFGDNTTSTAANPTHTYTQNGQYTVRLSVSDGVNTTLAPPLLIRVGNPPSVNIINPIGGSFFRAGDTISFSGNANDPDGALPLSAYTWFIDFLHSGHVHPGQTLSGATSGTFTIPSTGHDFSGDTRYQITLTVTDSDGLQSSQAVLVYPDKVNLTFDTVPTGLTLYLDGIAHSAPFTYDTLIGFNHTIEARNQSYGTTNYTFTSWSDGTAQQHGIVVPSAPQSYTATYIPTPLPQGLVAAWNFSETSGTTTVDSSSNGNTGTLTNGAVFAAGNRGNAVSLNGSTQFVDISTGTALQITGSMTVSGWVNSSAFPVDDAAVVSKRNNSEVGFQLDTTVDMGPRTIGFKLTNASGSLMARYGATTLQLNTWYHIAGVYDASAQTMNVYLNGVLNNATLLGTVTASQQNSSLNVNIGQRPGIPGTFNFAGKIDDVRIYNRALTPSEIQTDMTTALP